MLPRYATVALVGLALNIVITFVVVNIGGYWYGYALLAVISTVPAVSFLLSKYWAFGRNRNAGTQGE
jgi:putative flippase GtrA